MDNDNPFRTPFIPTEHDVPSSELVSELLSTHRSDSPLRKRARPSTSRCGSASSLDTMDTSNSHTRASKEPNIPARDTQYYFVDGSCVLCVGNTLFNVHRSLLTSDSSSFSTMFTLPQGNTPAEGTSDDNPIVLQGDTPEEFRNFLWSLYALPSEIMSGRGPRLDLSRFIDIARVASKYSFKSIETWALDAIQEFIEKKPSPLLDTISLGNPFPTHSPPSAFLESKHQILRLVQLAQMCNHANLLDTVIALLRQLMSTSPHFSYLAMSLADELNLRELRGLAYMEVLQRSVFICTEWNNELVEGDVHESADGLDRLVVSPMQQLRLLSGYHRLSRAWEKLRAAPPHFEHTPSCATTWHQHGCTQSWTDFWKEKTRADAVLSLGAANVLGKLQIILKEFDKWGSVTYMHHECKTVARRAIQDASKMIDDSLPDFFRETGEY